MSGALVIGGGPNGLAAAALLAKAGRSVTLVEREAHLGGMAAGFEFHPGFRCSGLLPRVVAPTALIQALSLDRHGLGPARDEPVWLPRGEAGFHLPRAIAGLAEACRAQGLPGEVAGAEALARLVEGARGVLEALLSQPAPEVQGQPDLLALAKQAIGLRRLGGREMMNLLRVAPTAIEDLLREQLADEALIAGLAADALPGTWTGPRSPGTTATWLLHQGAPGRATTGAALAAALASAAKEAGVKVLSGATVTRIRLQKGQAVGVDLADGSALTAELVVSALDPRRTLLDLVDPTLLPPLIEKDVRAVRARGAIGWVLLALSAPASFGGRADVAAARTGLSLNDWERSYDALKYGALPERPALDLRQPSLADAALAPKGGAVLEVAAHGVPYELRGGWSAAARATLAERVLAEVARISPGIRERVQGTAVIAPPDIEARTGATGGHVSHAELALDQLWVARPTLKLARHGTGIPGLILASPGTHPGGFLTGGSGMMAAAAAR